jgi:hypothetical protein
LEIVKEKRKSEEKEEGNFDDLSIWGKGRKGEGVLVWWWWGILECEVLKNSAGIRSSVEIFEDFQLEFEVQWRDSNISSWNSKFS